MTDVMDTEKREPIADVGPDAEELLQETLRMAAAIQKGQPLRFDCDYPNHKGEWIDYTPAGWRFKDLREYEEAVGVTELARLVCRKIVNWRLKVDGREIAFPPKAARDRVASLPSKSKDEAIIRERRAAEAALDRSYEAAMDELSPDLARFVWASYRLAYSTAGALSPNL